MIEAQKKTKKPSHILQIPQPQHKNVLSVSFQIEDSMFNDEYLTTLTLKLRPLLPRWGLSEGAEKDRAASASPKLQLSGGDPF